MIRFHPAGPVAAHMDPTGRWPRKCGRPPAPYAGRHGIFEPHEKGPLAEPGAGSPRASGTLEAHYAPRAKLRLMPAGMLNTALQMLADNTLKLAVYSRTVPLPAGSRLSRRAMPDDPDRAAHELFATLRELDAEGLDLIWVEEPPAGSAWDGVRDPARIDPVRKVGQRRCRDHAVRSSVSRPPER